MASFFFEQFLHLFEIAISSSRGTYALLFLVLAVVGLKLFGGETPTFRLCVFLVLGLFVAAAAYPMFLP